MSLATRDPLHIVYDSLIYRIRAESLEVFTIRLAFTEIWAQFSWVLCYHFPISLQSGCTGDPVTSRLDWKGLYFLFDCISVAAFAALALSGL